jgi:hypothetical protein
MELIKRFFKSSTRIKFHGIIHAHETPFETEEEMARWWLPERNGSGVEIRSPRMTRREKRKYEVAEAKNVLTTGGRNMLLAYMSIASGASPFAVMFSVGNGVVQSVAATDSFVVGEYFRKAPTGYTVTGAETDISIYFASTDGQGSITNAALFGSVAATTTLGTGTMNTHSLFNYLKTTQPITIDYTIIQN